MSFGLCFLAKACILDLPITVRTGSPDTTWIEVFRVSENMVTTPDFLANHNSGTAEGDVGFMSGCGNDCHFFNFGASPRVRYCVEIAKVNLSGIPRTPSGPPGFATKKHKARK